MDQFNPLGPSERSRGGSQQINGSGIRRPQTLMSPVDRNLISPPTNLKLTIEKDSNGFGMKVSGDNPVYVESVKSGGAAQRAGLIEGDMILKVNGTNVRYSTHTHVVELIKASNSVELTVQRNSKMHRPSSVSVSPSTPLAQRGGITGPKPVDSAINHEMKISKIQTLHLYLDKEKINLENLKASNNSNSTRSEILRAEQTIKTLQEQLHKFCGEGPTTMHLFNPIQSPIINPTVNFPTQQPTAPPSTPAFLSRFPRSLSSLSLGTKKKPDKDNMPTTPAPIHLVTSPSSSSATPLFPNHHHHLNSPDILSGTPAKQKSTGFMKDGKTVDVPPPLPERNIPRKQSTPGESGDDIVLRRNTQISDLDNSSSNNNIAIGTPLKSCTSSSSGGKGKQRSKQKIKALSDPKMSSQAFIQMEQLQYSASNNEAPPLPPRQPGMQLEEKQNALNNNKFGKNHGAAGVNRPPPNSLDTHMNYPLISTCTAVRDDLSAFPLSHRPNIVQQLQQSYSNQQQQQHQHHHHHHHQNQQLLISTTTTTPTANAVTSKSTALAANQQQSKFVNSNHRRVVSSPEHHYPNESFDQTDDRHNKSSSGSWDMLEHGEHEMHTPADGTPPPRYSPTPNQMDDSMTDSFFENSTLPLNESSPMRQMNVIHQRQIISMEDDEMADDQDSISEDHGPFRSLHQLLEPENCVYLSVFLNFVMSNLNPSPLLFYLITSLYKDGTIKDMRKWAYEIHSTFLVPRAPLLWCGVDESESLARDVDNILQNEHHKSEMLRMIFRKSRQRAKEHITQQIDEFKVKRTAGLGTMYGPSDSQLLDAKGDKTKEQKVFEETLLPRLQSLVDDLEKDPHNECMKQSALCSAFSTVLHRMFVTRSNPGSPIDRVHHFVSREKSFKNRLMGKSRKAMVRGHHLVLRQYYEVAHCNHCQDIIWGVSPQGYHCTDCELNIHRSCSKVLEENCPGPAPSKQKGQHADNKMTKFIDKIRPTHYFIQAERARRQDEDLAADDMPQADRPTSISVVRQPSDRRPDPSNNTAVHGQSSGELTPSHSIDADSNAPDAEPVNRESSKSKSAPVSVNRSESYKERLSHRRNRNNRRKTSDPSLSKTNDEQQVDLGINNANFTASSSSSLSSSLDSPSTSLEAVGAPTAGQGTVPIPRQWVDSEDEAGELEADWSSNVAADILLSLTDGEKKRQEVINEIYQTERNHVRTLRLLEGIFMRPLQESGALNSEHLNLLFPPALLTLKDHHSTFEQQLKQRRIEHGSLVKEIGDLLLAMFDGRSGDDLKEYAAQFCARQQIALEALKEKRRKDENLQRLLTKAESHKACRRLQLKDLLPTALQRLTKYPLLFESLFKITVRVSPDNEAEADAIKKALDSSKRILAHVNQAVRIAEDAHKLQTIQKKLDKTSYDKEASNEFKNLDLTQYKLLHDGPLIMKKNPSVQLHGLLFDNILVLLQKQDDKYILKYHSSPGGEGKNVEGRFNPISKINLILARVSAVDKNALFLLNTSLSQMLELTAPSSSECKTWFKHISDAADAYKSRTKGNHELTEDPASTTLSNSSTKESLEGTPEKELNTSTSSKVSLLNNNKEDESQVIGDEPNNNSNNKDDLLDRDESGGDSCNKNDMDRNENENDDVDVKVRKREYSNNSNNTRTLTQQNSLVAPSEVHVSVSPALTAEPVLTPNERLRRLDESIRITLAEKQQVVCDMFRVPNEHFTAIADIVGQPEAPKDPSDIVLAAFAQVQSLTETLNEYIKVTQHQEISAVSTSLCDECHKNSQLNRGTSRSCSSSSQSNNSLTNTSATTTATTVRNGGGVTTGLALLERLEHVTDDDGYCEIDDIRLPTVIAGVSSTIVATAVTVVQTSAAGAPPLPAAAATPELKRQSTISADSIPEETEHEINAESLATSTISEIVGDDCADSTVGGAVVAVAAAGVHIEINNDTYDSTSQQLSAEFNPEDSESIISDNQHRHLLLTNSCSEISCGANRLAHATALAPAVPCHLIASSITTLNLQISQLLPKINEGDIEREKLRKENQHLRELLNSMHERERVSNERETPDRALESRQLTSQDSND